MTELERKPKIIAFASGFVIALASLGLAVWLAQTWVVQGTWGVGVAWAIGIGTEMWVVPRAADVLEDRYA